MTSKKLCQRCKKNKATIKYTEGTMAAIHGFVEHLCQECFDKMQKATPLYKKAREQAFKDVFKVIDELNIELFLEDVVDEKTGEKVEIPKEIWDLWNIYWEHIEDKLKKELEKVK